MVSGSGGGGGWDADAISYAREGEKINSVIMSHFGIIHKA